MKKFNKFGYAGAIALATAMSFSACSSDDEMENINPSFDGSSVKTQFAISLTQKANKGGRMTTAQTQAEGAFQGMENIHLYHFNSSAISEATTNVGLTTLADFGAPDYQNTAANLNAKIYQNVVIATGVSHFLFYGQTSSADIADAKYTKATYADLNDRVDETKFEPVTIISTAKTEAFDNAKKDLVDTWTAIYALFTNNALPLSIQDYKAIIEDMANGGSASSNSMFALVKDI
jgi:hypothetical protein